MGCCAQRARLDCDAMMGGDCILIEQDYRHEDIVTLTEKSVPTYMVLNRLYHLSDLPKFSNLATVTKGVEESAHKGPQRNYLSAYHNQQSYSNHEIRRYGDAKSGKISPYKVGSPERLQLGSGDKPLHLHANQLADALINSGGKSLINNQSNNQQNIEGVQSQYGSEPLSQFMAVQMQPTVLPINFTQKEEMIIMIMNLMRAKPKLFVKQIEGLRSLYEMAPGMRYIPKAVLRPMDVDQSIAFLESCHRCQGLEISPELCQISREQTLVIPQSRIGGGDLSTIYNSGQMRKVGPSGGRRKSQNPSRQEQRSHSRQGSSESRLKQLLGTSGAQKNVQNDLDESFETIKQSSGLKERQGQLKSQKELSKVFCQVYLEVQKHESRPILEAHCPRVHWRKILHP
ncbi:hypothetical protein FGO68_gene11419 [Halteria grandinella]|uniref:Uncharacterized protein n=1 Tax=Halteria grandinella TaxID=5974 RepID=A0A8J8NT22_HALGN|nr:hypothetical protein FGO68_gene11419 [Halteria grandinella]